MSQRLDSRTTKLQTTSVGRDVRLIQHEEARRGEATTVHARGKELWQVAVIPGMLLPALRHISRPSYLSSPLHLLALSEVHALSVAGSSLCHEGSCWVQNMVTPLGAARETLSPLFHVGVLCSLEQRNVDPRTEVCSRELMPTRHNSMVMCF